jgi:phage terminase Nu1 subunit (DNA packaging protein)
MNVPATADAIGEPRALRKKSFAELVGVSPGRVSQMIRDGLPVEPDGRIDVARGKLWIKDHISPTRSAAQSDQDDLPFAAQADAADERRRLLKEQADGQALKNAVARRELVPASEIEREWTGIVRRARSAILAVPARLRLALPHLTQQDAKAIEAELRRVLAELADAK